MRYEQQITESTHPSNRRSLSCERICPSPDLCSCLSKRYLLHAIKDTTLPVLTKFQKFDENVDTFEVPYRIPHPCHHKFEFENLSHCVVFWNRRDISCPSHEKVPETSPQTNGFGLQRVCHQRGAVSLLPSDWGCHNAPRKGIILQELRDKTGCDILVSLRQ